MAKKYFLIFSLIFSKNILAIYGLIEESEQQFFNNNIFSPNSKKLALNYNKQLLHLNFLINKIGELESKMLNSKKLSTEQKLLLKKQYQEKSQQLIKLKNKIPSSIIVNFHSLSYLYGISNWLNLNINTEYKKILLTETMQTHNEQNYKIGLNYNLFNKPKFVINSSSSFTKNKHLKHLNFEQNLTFIKLGQIRKKPTANILNIGYLNEDHHKFLLSSFKKTFEYNKKWHFSLENYERISLKKHDENPFHNKATNMISVIHNIYNNDKYLFSIQFAYFNEYSHKKLKLNEGFMLNGWFKI